MINRKSIFDYVKDHVAHFGFFPVDYEQLDGETGEIIKYPDYMILFNKKQTKELSKLFNEYEEYT